TCRERPETSPSNAARAARNSFAGSAPFACDPEGRRFWGSHSCATLPRMRTIAATRYVTPLREGGSLPAIVEADDWGLYVVKFRGAGHGTKALVAELVTGELARAAGLRVPEIVLVDVDV